MADMHVPSTAGAAPMSDAEFVADRARGWAAFTRAATYGVVAIAVLLILLYWFFG